MIKLSILIPTIVGREDALSRLLNSIDSNGELTNSGLIGYGLNVIVYGGVQYVLWKDNREMSVGEKRNKLLEKAAGEYVAFIDDDDIVSENYVKLLLDAAETDCDCANLKGLYSVNGVNDGIFEHSIRYEKWRTNLNGLEVKYERFPTPLNMIKSSIAKQFKFPEKNHGEDHDWSKQIHESSLLKTEHYIPEIIYYYKYISNK